MSFPLIFAILLGIFAASQVYWFTRARALVRHFAQTRKTRVVALTIVVAAYLALFLLNFAYSRRTSPTRLTAYDAWISAPFAWWTVCSLLGFLLAILVWPVRRVARANHPLVSPPRRQFLEYGARAIIAAPFVAG